MNFSNSPSASAPHPDPDRIALGIRQPWAELILRGIKTVEVRSQDTSQRGTIYLYASKKVSELPAAQEAAERFDLNLDTLPRGLVVGTVEIRATTRAKADDAAAACLPPDLLAGQFCWRLDRPQRLPEPLPVVFLPYGVWFYPWKRRIPQRRRMRK